MKVRAAGAAVIIAISAWAYAQAPAAVQGTGPAPPSEWRAIPTGTTQSLMGVWGRSERDVYVVGHGLVLHYDGAAWTSATVAGS